MDTIIVQIDRIAKMVGSLLNLAREKRSDMGAAVELNQVIGDVVNLIQHELDRKNISFENDSSEAFLLKAEAGPLGQVLLNLLVNSVHAIEEARKTNPLQPHHIRLQTRGTKETVNISICDTGCGISEKNMSQLFKPFFTTKDIGHGTGLGLAISYKLVHSWGGSIAVESKENQGSTFTVTLTKEKGLQTLSSDH